MMWLACVAGMETGLVDEPMEVSQGLALGFLGEVSDHAEAQLSWGIGFFPWSKAAGLDTASPVCVERVTRMPLGAAAEPCPGCVVSWELAAEAPVFEGEACLEVVFEHHQVSDPPLFIGYTAAPVVVWGRDHQDWVVLATEKEEGQWVEEENGLVTWIKIPYADHIPARVFSWP